MPDFPPRTPSIILIRFALVCWATFTCGTYAFAETEAEVKAGYLLNFAKLVDWPASAFPDATSLVVGVVGRDAVGDEIARTLAGATANGRKLEIRRIAATDTAGLRRCHVVFVPQSERGDGIIAAVQGRPVLVVGEAEGFVRRGGALGFVKSGATVKFEANPQAAAKNGITVSAKLLRVALNIASS